MEIGTIYDLAFVAIILISIGVSAARGAFKAIAGIAGTVLGFLAAFKFSDMASPIIGRFIQPAVKATVEQAAKSAGVEGILENRLTESLSQMFEKLLGVLRISPGVGAEIGVAAQDTGGKIADAVTTGIVDQVAPVIAFILLFVIVKCAVSILCSVLSLDIPVLRTLNKGVGAILGAVSGLVIVAVLCWGILRLAPDDSGHISREALLESRVGSALSHILDKESGSS